MTEYRLPPDMTKPVPTWTFTYDIITESSSNNSARILPLVMVASDRVCRQNYDSTGSN